MSTRYFTTLSSIVCKSLFFATITTGLLLCHSEAYAQEQACFDAQLKVVDQNQSKLTLKQDDVHIGTFDMPAMTMKYKATKEVLTKAVELNGKRPDLMVNVCVVKVMGYWEVQSINITN